MAYDDDIVSTIRLKASDETGDVMRGMSERIKTTTEAFKKMAEGLGGAEVVRRSFEGYAELNRTLERLQFTTKMTDAQMKSLGDTFDDVSKHTGKSTDDIAKSFQDFYELTGQKYGPALEKMFKTIGEASAVTGASLESLSRIAGAAVNNMKVPQDQMDVLIKKLAVDLPGTLEVFSTMAPRITESLNTIGFSGAKNVEEAALAFNSLNRAFGNTRLSASAMNDLLVQLADGSSTFGKIMLPTLMEVRRNGGDVTEVFESMYQKLNAMHAFDANTPPSMLKVLGLDFNSIKAIKIFHDSLDETKKKLDESGESAGKFGERLTQVDKDAMTAINELSGSIENLKNSFGEFLVTVGANEGIRTFVDQLGSAKRLIDDISHGEWRKAGQEAGRPLFGPIPGEGGSEEHAKEQPSANPWSTWEGNALSRPGIAMRNAWRGMMSGPGKEPPKMARGGIVNKPTLIEAGEAGPEAIVPLDQSGGGGKTLDTEENTTATKDNTGALVRLSSLLSPTGDVSGLGMNFNRAMGGGGGNGGGTGYAGGARGSRGSRGGGIIPSDSEMDAKDKAWIGGHNGHGDHPAETSGDLSGGDAGPGGNNSALADQRSEIMASVDPATKHLMHQMLATEGGGTRTVEALLNRVAMIRKKIPGYSVKDELHSGFYGPINRGSAQRTGISGKMAAGYDRDINRAVHGGSNLIEGRTDQGTYGDPNANGPGRINVPGHNSEIYNFWKGSRHGHQFGYGDTSAWARHQNELAATPSATAGGNSDTQTVMKINGHDFPMGGASNGDKGGSVFDKGTSPLSHFHEQHQSMREDMERPIRMSVEAPTPPPLYSYRQRMARQQSRYQADDQLQAPRYASQMDIGFA